MSGWPNVQLARDRFGRVHFGYGVQTETYVPLSALLSDEVVEAVARGLYQQTMGRPVSPLTEDSILPADSGWREEARELLQAASKALQEAEHD